MSKIKQFNGVGIALSVLFLAACSTPALIRKTENRSVPGGFANQTDTVSSATTNWRSFFKDPYLVSLIDTALSNNQELNIVLQEIEISKNEIQAKKGEYLPSVSPGGGIGADKAARYTLSGATVEGVEMKPGKKIPDPLGDFRFGAYANWEVDIWHKLRNAKKAQVNRYLASIEGRNFMVTNLIAEIAESYYELLALDNQLRIVRQNVEVQQNALKMVRMQKEATRVTELAVKRFEAQVLNTQSLQYEIGQKIVEAENRINFLVGRFPRTVDRDQGEFLKMVPEAMQFGSPVQLLQSRPDIRQAEQELTAAKIDIDVARANFYPSLGLSANLGTQAFNPAYLIKMPWSIFSSLIGDMVGPLINKNAIKANYRNANAKQIQAVYSYERTVLNAYIEVANQVSRISNLEKSFDLKSKEVDALNESVTISNRLFASARADYTEVLFTQRDAIESRFDLVETRMQQMSAVVSAYRALGGGWR